MSSRMNADEFERLFGPRTAEDDARLSKYMAYIRREGRLRKLQRDGKVPRIRTRRRKVWGGAPEKAEPWTIWRGAFGQVTGRSRPLRSNT